MEILAAKDRDLQKAFQGALRIASKINLARPIKVRKIKMDAPLFRIYLWGRLLDYERQGKGAGKWGVFHAEIYAADRLFQLLGDAAFFRELPSTSAFAFVAPKALVTTKWSSEAADTLKLEPGDYLAILGQVPNSDFVVAYHPAAPASWVNFQGHKIQGATGICSKKVLHYEHPITFHYSPRTTTLTFSFPCWVFNANGNLMSQAFVF